MRYRFERLDISLESWFTKISSRYSHTIFQTPAWLVFLSQTQKGEVIVAALKEGQATLGYFTGMIVRKFGFRILGSPFPGWSTSYMGFHLTAEVDKRQAVQALIDFAFDELGCVHLEMMDRNLTLKDLEGLGVEYRMHPGFEIDLNRSVDELFSHMTSACRRCIRKAEKEGVIIEEAQDSAFAHDYYAQLRDVFAKQRLVPTYDIERVRHLIINVHPTGHLLLLRACDPNGRCIATNFPASERSHVFLGRGELASAPNLAPERGASMAGDENRQTKRSPYL